MTRYASILARRPLLFLPLLLTPVALGDRVQVRLARCRIADDSPLRKSDDFNSPLQMYVVAKRGDTVLFTTSAQSTWDASFQSSDYEISLDRDSNRSITFTVYDAQWGTDPEVFSVKTTESSLAASFLKKRHTSGSDTVLTLSGGTGATIDLAFIGIAKWFRLQNVDIPDGVEIREDHSQPILTVRVYRDGRPLRNASGSTWSSTLPKGWSGTFPRQSENFWMILSDSSARYDVELWDLAWRNELLFKFSNLKGEDFGNPVTNATDFEQLDEFERDGHPVIVFVEADDGPPPND